MKSFVKALWSRTKREGVARELSNPEDLDIGDLIQLSDSFGLPPRLRDQIFKVIGITSYQFEHEYSSCFSLEGKNQDHIDLSIEKDAGRSIAAFSLAIDRSLVEQIFDLDEFALVFDPEETAELAPLNTLDLDPWLAKSYVQEAKAERGFFYQKDCRKEGPSLYEGDGEAFEYYLLSSADHSHAIEIEVYAGGETEVSLTLYRPIEDITDLWPGKKE